MSNELERFREKAVNLPAPVQIGAGVVAVGAGVAAMVAFHNLLFVLLVVGGAGILGRKVYDKFTNPSSAIIKGEIVQKNDEVSVKLDLQNRAKAVRDAVRTDLLGEDGLATRVVLEDTVWINAVRSLTVSAALAEKIANNPDGKVVILSDLERANEQVKEVLQRYLDVCEDIQEYRPQNEWAERMTAAKNELVNALRGYVATVDEIIETKLDDTQSAFRMEARMLGARQYE